MKLIINWMTRHMHWRELTDTVSPSSASILPAYLSVELYSRFLTWVVYSLETRELLPGSGQNTVAEHCSQDTGYTNSPESEQLT